MGNQHSNQLNLKQLNLKQLNKKIKQKSRINLSSLSSGGKAKVKERGSAFLCHSNGSLIANVQFRCTFCSTVKRSAFAIKSHYGKRHHFFESAEQLNEAEPKSDYFSIEASGSDRSRASNCTLFIQDHDLIVRCATLSYGVMKFDENGDQVDSQRSDQLESDLRLKRINELSKLRQELTKLNAFSRLVESAEKEQGPVRGESIRIRKFDDDSSNVNISNEDQLNNNYKFAKNKDRKIPNSASDGTNSSSSSLCPSDGEQTQIDEHLFGLNDLAKEVEQISETSSIDTTFGLDARCCVCDSKNYVVCIQRRLGKQICANCFRFFRHFLSDPVVYGCEQLGKCDLSKPIKPIGTHASHNQRKSTATTGTAAKHVVKQQQLGIFKSKSNTLQSTPKSRRPLQQKELSFYSIASYGTPPNSHSLNDQSKSMTLNLPSKNYPYKERNLSPNQSSWTSPSPTQSNVSFALKANGELDYNSNLAISAIVPARARCNACWIKKCIDIYYDISFDDKIMKILQDFRPIQLTNLLDENKSVNFSVHQQKSSNQLNQPQFGQSNGQTANGTLTKQKRYYTNNKFKSKSVSRLYYNNQTEKSGPVKGKTTTVVDQSIASRNGLGNRLNANKTDPTNGQNQSFNDSVNGSNCSSSINDSSNNSNNELNESNTTSDTNGKNQITTCPANGSKTGKPLSNIPTPIKAKSNGKLNGNHRSNSSTSNASSSTVNLAPNPSKASTKSRMSNTITLNNLPFKSNAFNAMSNKPNVNKHSTILPNGCNVLSSSMLPVNDARANGEPATSDEEQSAKQELDESAKCSHQANQTNGDQCVNDKPDESDQEHRTEAANTENVTKNGSVCLIFNEHSDPESQQNVNTIEVIGDTDKPAKTKTDSHFFKLSSDNNLNLLYTNIHTMPERV